MPKGINLTEEQKEFILKHHKEMLLSQMAKLLGVHRVTVKKFLEKAGIHEK